MKKNNKTTVYILLPAVVVIWGLIFYRIFGGISTDSVSSFSSNKVPPVSRKEILSEPKFRLDLDYPDPFLGGRLRKSENQPLAASPAVQVMPEEPVMPPIEYRGCVSNRNGTTAYLVINGQIHLCGIGQVVDEVAVIQIQEDSVLVGFEKKRQWFNK